jgi:DNA-binding transcriptional LysR family regulator
MAQSSRFEAHIGQRLKLRELHILSSVVQWGSMAKAADQLGMTQPAVSDAIGSFEAALGVRLLDRNRRGITPTIYALALLKHGNVVFDELRQGIREIEFLRNPEAGEVRMACSEALAAGFVPAIINEFSRRQPLVSFHLVEENTGTMHFRELRERNVDFMLGFVSATRSDDDVEMEVLFNDQVFVVAGRQSKWAKRRKIRLAELTDEPWILGSSNNAVRSIVIETFRARGLSPPREKVTSNSAHVRLHLLATGRFLTVMAGCVVRHNEGRWPLTVLPVDFGNRQLPIAVVTLKNRTLSPAAQRFIEYARDVAKPLAARSSRRSVR